MRFPGWTEQAIKKLKLDPELEPTSSLPFKKVFHFGFYFFNQFFREF